MKSSWKDDYGDSLNVELLRAKFAPPQKFRVSEFKYAAGVKYNGSMLPGKCFVLKGNVTYQYDNYEIHLAEGEVGQLPQGSYTAIAG
ncbi:MAG: hypothetical protein AAGB04_31585, partial [Pseudomonadota bacterium]